MTPEVKENPSPRKNLIRSLIAGLVLGGIIGSTLGWFAHSFYTEKRLEQILICREKNRNQPEAYVQSLCGSWF